MHIQKCALCWHFNEFKSFNWQQRKRMAALFIDSLASLERAVSLSVMQNIFRVFVYQACSAVSALWQLMWQLHSGFQFSGHVVLERKQEDGTQLIWLPMMYITHPRPTSQRDGQARSKGCWLSVNKAWVTCRQTICEDQPKIRDTCMPLN